MTCLKVMLLMSKTMQIDHKGLIRFPYMTGAMKIPDN